MSREQVPEIELDCVGMLPPAPMEHALEALARLLPGQRLRMRLDREPHPLLRMLSNNAYQWQLQQEGTAFVLTAWEQA